MIIVKKLCAILWAVGEDEAENILTMFTGLSLTIRHWISKAGSHGYTIHGLQLDLLKSSIDSIDQAVRCFVQYYILNLMSFCLLFFLTSRHNETFIF